jgi:MFS superfamily sulfate permease-like transporter
MKDLIAQTFIVFITSSIITVLWSWIPYITLSDFIIFLVSLIDVSFSEIIGKYIYNIFNVIIIFITMFLVWDEFEDF